MNEKTFRKMYSKEEIKAIANDGVVTSKTGCRRMWTEEEIKAIAGENKPSGNTLSAYFARNQITEIGPKDFDPSQTVIGQYLFANQSNLERIIIPDSITTIETKAFDGCNKCIYIEFGLNVSSIGDVRPSGNTTPKLVIKFKSLTPPTFTEQYPFYAPKLQTIYVPNEALEAYKAAPGFTPSSIVEKIVGY